jgi:hypothetical protein
MPLRPRDDRPAIDLRAPASTPGQGGFVARHPPGTIGRSVADPGGGSSYSPLRFAQSKGALPIGVATKTPLLGLHSLPGNTLEMQAFFRGRWNISPKEVKSWQEFAAAVKEASPVGKLIVYCHGGPGQARIGDTEFGLEQTRLHPFFLSLCRARIERGGLCGNETIPGSAFCRRHHPPTLEQWVGPLVHAIEFEGCLVGARPDSMAAFAKVLGASKISGFTWFHAARSDKFTIPKGTAAAEVAKLIAGVSKYLVEGQPTPDEIARQAQHANYKVNLWVEYFLAGGSAGGPGKIPDGAVARSEVQDRTVRAAEAPQLQEEYDATVTPPCLRVIVTVDA